VKLHFDPNQQFQLDAINSIVGVFEGQPLNYGGFGFTIDDENYMFQEGGVGNRLTISEEQILENVRSVQAKTNCPFQKRSTACTFPWRWKQAPARPMCISERFMN
jgi:hypothetical protein